MDKLKFEVNLDETTGNVEITLKHFDNVGFGSVVGLKTIVDRWWYLPLDMERKTTAGMGKMVRRFFKNRKKNIFLRKRLNELAREEYNLEDPRVIDLLKKYRVIDKKT